MQFRRRRGLNGYEEETMPKLKVYEREIVDERTYPSALAQSIHFAVSLEGAGYEPLNYNYGVLYPKAEISPEDTILERGARQPRVIRRGEYVYFLAEFADSRGNLLAPEKIYLWKTADFKEYFDLGLASKGDLPFDLREAGDTLDITLPELQCLLQRFGKLRFSHILLPETVSRGELGRLEAQVVYSDGSVDKKPVRWSVAPGSDRAEGEVLQQKYSYPSACGWADPVIYKYEGAWYYLATNDNTGDVGLYIRRAETVEGLFAPDNEPCLILPYDEKRDFVQTFWAPEFHEIGGELYILLAIGGRQWSPHSHMMKLKKGEDLRKEGSWEEPVRVVRSDGSDLAPGRITLDMTCFSIGKKYYLCWSQRRFDPDSGSMLYIAETEEKTPWVLKTEPVLLSRPLYGWENQSGTVNNEGPYPLFVGDKLYLTYSGGAAGGYSYVVGFLELEPGLDPLDPKNWRKSVCPECSSVMFSDREGPAHNSFFTGDDGKTYFACHAQRPGDDNHRNTSITRLHINADGRPVLGLEPEEDLPREAGKVSVRLI